MKKKFNITGLCFPQQHYMADVSEKLEQAYGMVEDGEYFIINRPRQYGKTTMLYTLADRLRKTDDYIVLNMSFEGIGDAIFKDETTFSPRFIKLLAKYARIHTPKWAKWLLNQSAAVESLDGVSDLITDMVLKTDKQVVLMIDEVDKSSNNQLFVNFLAVLRNKYLERASFKTFHSVVLAGVHDVKSLKLKLRTDEESKYNSPWNIAAAFEVDMNLQVSEIKPMLAEYSKHTSVKMDAQTIAEKLFYYTSGYPFLVSKLCKMVDEAILPTKTNQEWTVADVDLAVANLVKETNTNFDNLIKNLENNADLYALIHKQLIEGVYQAYSIHDPVINLGLLHGILKNGRGFTIHNRIYEEVIYDYMMSKTNAQLLFQNYSIEKSYRLPHNKLNMELVLVKFQAFMRDQYSRKDRDFLEKNGRLVFLAFLKPIINGSGYDFKEAQVSEERRLDVVITYFQHKYLAELKIWRGQAAHEEGLTQLANYLDRQALTEGYLLIFDHANIKTWHAEWIEWQGKRIFIVWV